MPIIKIQRQEATSIKTAVFFLSLSSTLMLNYLLNSPLYTIKNTKGFHEYVERTIAYCEVISIVDMGSNFFDEFPLRDGFHLKSLSFLFIETA